MISVLYILAAIALVAIFAGLIRLALDIMDTYGERGNSDWHRSCLSIAALLICAVFVVFGFIDCVFALFGIEWL